MSVAVARDNGTGLEAAAREARYAALRAHLQTGEILVTAQHADDQLETMLLALLRGAGVRGLAAMRPWQRFAPGWLARPLLSLTRDELAAEATRRGLTWIEDPTNDDLNLDRNYLRQRVLPLLRERWPSAARAGVRASGHLADAEELIESVAAADLARVAVGPCVELGELGALDRVRRRNALRLWIRRAGGRPPTQRKLAAIEHDMFAAQTDRLPVARWDGGELRRYRGLLYYQRVLPRFDRALRIPWTLRGPCELPAGLGRLRAEPTLGQGVAESHLHAGADVRFRSGGETFTPSGDAHRRVLKKLLQAANILPWWRERLPLIYVGDQLAAVADLWVAEEFAARANEGGVRIFWDGRPEVRAQRRDDPAGR